MNSNEKWHMVNGFVQSVLLLATFLGALYIGCKQNELNEYAIEKDIKPILLREGYLSSFGVIPMSSPSSSPATTQINFGNIRLVAVHNVATDIAGFIVVSGHMYKLNFGNQITAQTLQQNGTSSLMMGFLDRWSWISEGGTLSFVADVSTKTAAEGNDRLVIEYSSLAGKRYQFIEDHNHAMTIKSI